MRLRMTRAAIVIPLDFIASAATATVSSTSASLSAPTAGTAPTSTRAISHTSSAASFAFTRTSFGGKQIATVRQSFSSQNYCFCWQPPRLFKPGFSNPIRSHKRPKSHWPVSLPAATPSVPRSSPVCLLSRRIISPSCCDHSIRVTGNKYIAYSATGIGPASTSAVHSLESSGDSAVSDVSEFPASPSASSDTTAPHSSDLQGCNCSPSSPSGVVSDDNIHLYHSEGMPDTSAVQGRIRLRLVTGAVAIPHPEKAAKGGEDAYFASSLALGVFDGVGGWASVGVDPGLYSKELAATTARLIHQRGPESALDSLIAAVDDNTAVGSSTACVVGLVHDSDGDAMMDLESEFPDSAKSSHLASSGPLNHGTLSSHTQQVVIGESNASVTHQISEESDSTFSPSFRSDLSGPRTSGKESITREISRSAEDCPQCEENLKSPTGGPKIPPARILGVNLGDSGLIVIRDNAIVFATKEQQHYFNCPFQVGSGVGADSVDSPQMGDVVDVPVLPGDILVLASDGLWDNAFPHEILAIVSAHASLVENDLTHLELSPAATTSSESLSSSGVGSQACATSNAPNLDDNLTPPGSPRSEVPRNSKMSPVSSAADPQEIAKALADFALQVALDDRRQSPFAVNAQDAGHIFRGGKLDDITVVTAVVTCVREQASSTPPSSPITPAVSPHPAKPNAMQSGSPSLSR